MVETRVNQLPVPCEAEPVVELFAEKRILTVPQLTSLIKGVLEENFEHVWVQGEISNLTLPLSGHCYFTLKGEGAQIRCVMFRASARALKFKPKDGLGLIVRGRISLFEPRGEYQLVVEYLEPQGVGALQLAFTQLQERLLGEGLFDEAHKKPLPKLPQRIGIVTSPTGAAIHDILTVLRRRFANVEILLYPVRVQGDGAALEIARAVAEFNRYREVDVLIVGRGGGSLEDLWAFNEEVVARAVYASRIPVISAVGHEVDFTIMDFVADLRAPTPSAAAELVVRSKRELESELEALRHRLVRGMEQNLAQCKSRIDSLSRSLKEPAMLVEHLAQRVDDLSERLGRAGQVGMAHRRHRLAYLRNSLRLQSPALSVARAVEALEALTAKGEHALHRILEKQREAVGIATGKLQGMSPLATLARGYAVVQSGKGEVVVDSGRLRPGDRFRIRLHRGAILGRVEETFSADPKSRDEESVKPSPVPPV